MIPRLAAAAGSEVFSASRREVEAAALGVSAARRVAGGGGGASGSDPPAAPHRGAAAADDAAIAVADHRRNRGRATMTTTTLLPTRHRVGHRDRPRHADLPQPEAMAGAAPKVAAAVMAVVVITAALVAKVHSLDGTRWKSSMIAAIVVLFRPRNTRTRRAPSLVAEVGDPPLIWQLGYRWMVALHVMRRNLHIPREAGRRTTNNRW